MNRDAARLLHWLRRAAPPRRNLVAALVARLIASLTAAGLFVGAVALLVVSATRPGLRAVAGVLIVIELLAFLRSPLRFRDNRSAFRGRNLIGLRRFVPCRRVFQSTRRWRPSRWTRRDW